MTRRQRKLIYYTLEGTSSLACTYHLNYLFFLFHTEFGFGNRENLMVSALHGGVYMLTAWWSGRVSRQLGCLATMRLGFAGMALAQVIGLFTHTAALKLGLLAAWTFSMTFIWPSIQSLVSRGEDEAALPGVVGLYNCIWAGASGLAFFAGGAMFEGAGHKSVYWLPLTIHIIQFAFVSWLMGRGDNEAAMAAIPAPGHHEPEPAAASQPVSPQTFLKMAWLANPVAYVAINTVTAIMPELTSRLNLSVTENGLLCSVWFFARLIAFFALWHWTGWHYRFRWMVAAFVALIAGYTVLVQAENLWLLAGAQAVFGLGAGLLYYASLFYAMDVGEGSSEHGGWHESAIGAGIFLGPALGATAMQLAPGQPQAGLWAVSGLLVIGFGALIWMRTRSGKLAAR